jgi:hypothetical protein
MLARNSLVVPWKGLFCFLIIGVAICLISVIMYVVLTWGKSQNANVSPANGVPREIKLGPPSGDELHRRDGRLKDLIDDSKKSDDELKEFKKRWTGQTPATRP